MHARRHMVCLIGDEQSEWVYFVWQPKNAKRSALSMHKFCRTMQNYFGWQRKDTAATSEHALTTQPSALAISVTLYKQVLVNSLIYEG